MPGGQFQQGIEGVSAFVEACMAIPDRRESPRHGHQREVRRVHIGDFATARGSWEHYLRLAPTGPEVGRVRAAIEALTKLMHVLEAHAEATANG